MSMVVHHVAVQTADFEHAFRFFTAVLGLEVIKPPSPFKKRTLAILSAGTCQLELFSHKNDESPFRYSTKNLGPTHLAFVVDDLEGVLERCAQMGVRILKHPFDPPGSKAGEDRVSFIEGPDGQEIEIRGGQVL